MSNAKYSGRKCKGDRDLGTREVTNKMKTMQGRLSLPRPRFLCLVNAKEDSVVTTVVIGASLSYSPIRLGFTYRLSRKSKTEVSTLNTLCVKSSESSQDEGSF